MGAQKENMVGKGHVEKVKNYSLKFKTGIWGRGHLLSSINPVVGVRDQNVPEANVSDLQAMSLVSQAALSGL